jgi:two-component system sensor histidine kinase MprB
VLFGVGALGVAVAAGLGLVVARGALGPVERLTQAAEHVAETQDLAAAIEVDRNDEVGRLAQAFNAMLAALSESRQQQERLVRDAGHELRTPLTALRTNIELLARAAAMPADQRAQLLADATVELEELSALVEEVVDVATDTAIAREPVVVLRLDELVERVADRAGRRTGRKYLVTAEPSEIDGREAALERAVGNLLDNANKWSPDGAEVEVTLERGRLTVRDRGPGLEVGDLDRVFDRFYRADSARSMPGSGLGLSIVKRIVEEHDGDVFAENHSDGGAVVGFELPRR